MDDDANDEFMQNEKEAAEAVMSKWAESGWPSGTDYDDE